MPDWIRIAVELRHPSWDCEDVYRLLEHHNAAYCVMSGAGLPCVLRATADFVYVRLHGPDHHHLYGGSYSDADLSWWRDRLREWESTGKDVFVYFNNDGEANAVRNALRPTSHAGLKARTGLEETSAARERRAQGTTTHSVTMTAAAIAAAVHTVARPRRTSNSSRPPR